MTAIKKDKKTGIIYRHWAAAGEPRAILLLVHGLGAHSARWDFLSDFFLQKGVSSYAIELRGFGETKGLRGHVDSFRVYFRDLRRLRDIIIEENRDRKIFLLGESLGAVISFLAAIPEPGLFGGLVCISPAFMSRLKASPLEYIKILLSLARNPKKQFKIPFDSGMCTRDAGCREILDSDSRELRSATAKFIFEIVKAQIQCAILKKKMRTPALFLLSGEDKLADPEASKRIFNGIKTDAKKLIQYPGMYHALSIDLGRERVFEDIFKWMEKRI